MIHIGSKYKHTKSGVVYKVTGLGLMRDSKSKEWVDSVIYYTHDKTVSIERSGVAYTRTKVSFEESFIIV